MYVVRETEIQERKKKKKNGVEKNLRGTCRKSQREQNKGETNTVHSPRPQVGNGARGRETDRGRGVQQYPPHL